MGDDKENCYRQGLFGNVYDGEVKNLGIENADIIVDLNDASTYGKGILVDWLCNSKITNCWTSVCSVVWADAGHEADNVIIRYSEILLIYAEAVCELGGGNISDADLDYSINKVRERAGVAPLNAALIAKANSLGGQLELPRLSSS